MKNAHEILKATALELLETTGRISAQDVLDYALAEHAEEMYDVQELAMRQGWLRQIKGILKETADNDGLESHEPAQLGLPGFRAPAALPVPDKETREYIYVSFRKMTWVDLLGALKERDTNSKRVNKRRQDLREKAEYLRPVMSDNLTLTLEEAAMLLKKESAA